MPLYSYRCNACGVQTDRKQGFDDPPLEVCPECGEKELRKLYAPVGILFKGPGFYATDNRSSSGANGNSPGAQPDKGKTSEAEKDSSKDKAPADKAQREEPQRDRSEKTKTKED